MKTHDSALSVTAGAAGRRSRGTRGTPTDIAETRDALSGTVLAGHPLRAGAAGVLVVGELSG